jgi:hypothetical protein
VAEYKIQYYVGLLDIEDDKESYFAIYAYPASSEVAFLHNMKYFYPGKIEQVKVFTDYNDLLNAIVSRDTWSGVGGYHGIPSLFQTLYEHMSPYGTKTDHVAINFSIYRKKDKE